MTEGCAKGIIGDCLLVIRDYLIDNRALPSGCPGGDRLYLGGNGSVLEIGVCLGGNRSAPRV